MNDKGLFPVLKEKNLKNKHKRNKEGLNPLNSDSEFYSSDKIGPKSSANKNKYSITDNSQRYIKSQGGIFDKDIDRVIDNSYKSKSTTSIHSLNKSTIPLTVEMRPEAIIKGSFVPSSYSKQKEVCVTPQKVINYDLDAHVLGDLTPMHEIARDITGQFARDAPRTADPNIRFRKNKKGKRNLEKKLVDYSNQNKTKAPTPKQPLLYSQKPTNEPRNPYTNNNK